MKAPLWSACLVAIPAIIAILVPVVSLYAPIPLVKLPALIGLFAVPLYGTALAVWIRSGRPIERAVSQWVAAGRPERGAEHVWRMLDTVPTAVAKALATGGLASSLVALLAMEALLDRPISDIPAAAILTTAAVLWTAVLYFFLTDLHTRPTRNDAASHLPPDFAPPGRGMPFGRRMLGAITTASVLAALVGVLITDRGQSSVSELVGPIVGAVGVALLFSVALTIAAARSMLRPVGDLTAAASRVADGDLGARAAVTSDDEFGRLSVTFNTMTAELQRSRERLVSAREEERRRLRRDLHDGLGPSLAGIALRLEAVRARMSSDPATAEAMLVQLRADTVEAIADIRRLVHGLRPPQLDDLGLVGAIEDRAARLAPDDASNHCRIRVEAPSALPGLPAAVEVASYRIVEEALTNVVRHADARNCTVRLIVDGDLAVEISDDGRGVGDGRRAGVGLNSMRERAAELGGTCSVQPSSQGGTIVLARLPLPDGPG